MDGLRDPRHRDEIRHHIEERVARLVEEGVDPVEARQRALRAFGDPEAVRRELADIEAGSWGRLARAADRFTGDLSFATRQLRRSPGYAATAILTLGLGIGSATAIFGLVKSVVLDPLPYPDSDRIVEVSEVTPDGLRFSVAEPNFRDFRERARGLEHMTAMSRADLAAVVDGRPVNVVARRVTGGFFPLFGADPTVGRVFGEDESGADARSVAVVSHAFWRDRLDGDPDAIGSVVPLDGTPYEVIGVMPAGWEPVSDGDVWIPLPFTQEDRTNHDLSVVARAASGFTLDQARTDLERVATELGSAHPETNGGWSTRLTPLKERLLGEERIRAGWVLLAAVGMLLALACASISNLFLARASIRGREMGLRAALGAGRARLAQQLLTESLVVGLTGAAVGIVLARLLLPALRALSPADTPRLDQVGLDPAVMAFAVAVGVGTALVFGLAPVLHVTRGRLGALTHGGGREVGRASEGTRATFVAAQVAVSLTLLFGAGVLMLGFLRLAAEDVGLDVEHTLVVPLMLSGDRYSMEERAVTADRLHDALAALPGVAAVGVSNIVPFSGANTSVALRVEGREVAADEAPFVRWRAVSPSYFDAASLPLLHGRLLERADAAQEAEEVVVITRSLASRLFGEPARAVGERVAFGWNGTNYRRIVGVVADLEDVEVTLQTSSVLFFPHGGFLPWTVAHVRMRPGAPVLDGRDIREAIWAVDGSLPVPSVEYLADRLGTAVATPRFNVVVLAALGSVALALSLAALYGLVLFALRTRMREIGVRLALGARPERVVRLLVRRGAAVAAAGLLGGIILSVAFGRSLETLVHGTSGRDPWVLAAAMFLVGATALVATWIPASRATSVDPRETLNAE